MPILKEEIKEIILPKSGTKVKFLAKITYGKMLEFQERGIKNEKEAGMEMAVFLIMDWDLTDEKKKKLPFSVESIKSLEFEDGNFLISEINKAIKEKKTSI
jgi:hypothetical protein